MPNITQTDSSSSLEFPELIVNYTDGDVDIFDHATDLEAIYQLKPMTNLIVMGTAGSLKMTANKLSLEIKANEVLCCPSNIALSNFNASPDFECKALRLSDHIIQRLLHDKIHIWNNAVYVNRISTISMSEICRTEIGFYYALLQSKITNHKSAKNFDIIQALIRALLLEVCVILESRSGEIIDEKMSQGKMIFNRFLNMVSNNEVKRQPINKYASQLAITPKYLTMLCLKYSDKTASDWIIQYTTEDIRFYLKNSNLSIKEISAKLGFANMSHFGSYVRKHLGMSPSDFRHHRN